MGKPRVYTSFSRGMRGIEAAAYYKKACKKELPCFVATLYHQQSTFAICSMLSQELGERRHWHLSFFIQTVAMNSECYMKTRACVGELLLDSASCALCSDGCCNMCKAYLTGAGAALATLATRFGSKATTLCGPLSGGDIGFTKPWHYH